MNYNVLNACDLKVGHIYKILSVDSTPLGFTKIPIGTIFYVLYTYDLLGSTRVALLNDKGRYLLTFNYNTTFEEIC